MFLQHRHNGEKSWLGLNDISTEGSFTWADRGAGNFTAWAKNQPNNFKEEDCVHTLGVEHNYKWNDVKCSDCHQYTCKKGRLLMLIELKMVHNGHLVLGQVCCTAHVNKIRENFHLLLLKHE